ncbi:MAG: helix-turn-helix transcriptional regulator [Melioribacteraceae bacterium]
MKSFGEYLRRIREEKQLPLRKVAAALDIDTSILSKIERNERRATIEMLPVFCKVFEKSQKEMQTEYIKSLIISELGDLEYIKNGLKETLKSIS